MDSLYLHGPQPNPDLMKYLVITLLTAILCANIPLSANNIRQINTRNGLSNSAVIHLYQDRERSLWVGTYDGLNKYNGFDIQIFKSDINNQSGLSGNIVRRIIESEGDCLWVMTKGGLNKFLKKEEKVEAFFPEFQEDCTLACDSRGIFFILTQTGLLHYYDSAKQEFREIAVPNLEPPASWIGLRIDARDRFWIMNNKEVLEYALDGSGSEFRLEWLGRLDHPHPVVHLYSDRGDLFLIDDTYDLFVISRGEKIFIRNILSEVKEYGTISSIIYDGRDIVIGFWISGVVRLNNAKSYAPEKIPINCGVTTLLKDEVQDILWIGTDGQGLQAYTHDEYTFRGINLEDLPLKTQRPVRAVFSLDGDLWLGTKGDGIIRIRGYENSSEYNNQGNVEYLSVEDGLNHNSVLTFEMSRANNVLWIGTGGEGVNYYDFEDNKIHTLHNTGRDSFSEVQSILETSENTLWVSSKYSLFKIDVRRIGNALEVRSMQRYEFNIKNRQIFNNIYGIVPENDSIMWLAMRGNGAIRFNNRNGSYRPVTFDENGIAPMNDILSIHADRDGNLWFGSGYGINKITIREDGGFRFQNYNDNDGLPDNTIHGILEDADGNLWLSSNTGLILFERDRNAFRHFNHDSGLKVIEFSDNAYYKDDKSSKYFFGGTDGVVWVEPGEKKDVDFVPPIYFSKLQLLNEKSDIDDFLVQKGGKKFLRLKHNQNFFTVFFYVNDFLEGTSKKFSYILEDFNEVWMHTATREAQFTNIPPGRYTLKVRYDNEPDESGQESRTANLEIRILAPWYFSAGAKVLYFFTAIGLMILIHFYITRRYERKRIKLANELSRQYKEEMYENKLRFFTNITHEFCTPLTLIQTPGKRIFNYEGSDDYIRKYAQIILSNSERLNTLIQEIIDFRRMETGNKVIRIERCDIGRICGEISDAFADIAEENGIDFSLSTEGGIVWNSDPGCITTILNNLVSNAFKYTERNGKIKIEAGIADEKLVLSVYNSGKGIPPEDIPRVFNRYAVLDNVEQNMMNSISSRNGLGLAICKSMVELLGGHIGIESSVGEYARFIVRLPVLELQKQAEVQTGQALSEQSAGEGVEKNTGIANVGKDVKNHDLLSASGGRPGILIVDDNEEILFMLQDILSEDYAVITAKDGREGMDSLLANMPDLVLTDIMMPNHDGISMTKQIKLNPHTMHIPIIIISAKSAIDDKIEGMESGADAYVTKPFDEQYLKTIVRQLIKKHSKLREYYNSSASSYNYLNGKLLSNETRDFIRQAVQIIDNHIDVVEFSPEDLADNMRISLRTLYRRFKESDLPAPKDFINRQRIEYSARLLVSTRQTIQEIIYAAGFTTRSHFYKEFMRRYGQSPTEYRSSGGAALGDPDTSTPYSVADD